MGRLRDPQLCLHLLSPFSYSMSRLRRFTSAIFDLCHVLWVHYIRTCTFGVFLMSAIIEAAMAVKDRNRRRRRTILSRYYAFTFACRFDRMKYHV